MPHLQPLSKGDGSKSKLKNNDFPDIQYLIKLSNLKYSGTGSFPLLQEREGRGYPHFRRGQGEAHNG
jgi:hypothetical protein